MPIENKEITHKSKCRGKREYIPGKKEKGPQTWHSWYSTSEFDKLDKQTKKDSSEEKREGIEGEELKFDIIAKGYPTASQARIEEKREIIEKRLKYPRHENERKTGKAIHEGPTRQDQLKRERRTAQKEKRKTLGI